MHLTVDTANTANTMDTFEDENPFEQDGERISSETSSTSQVVLYEPSTPPSHPSRQLSPASPHMNRPPFPSAGSHRPAQSNFKTDFCCTRDRVLHSGEDVEILVRGYHNVGTTPSLTLAYIRLRTHRKLLSMLVRRTSRTSLEQA